MRPRGSPPIPNAKSNAIDPVGMDFTALSEGESPSRITAPRPNAFSICARANSRVLSRSLLVPLTETFVSAFFTANVALLSIYAN